MRFLYQTGKKLVLILLNFGVKSHIFDFFWKRLPAIKREQVFLVCAQPTPVIGRGSSEPGTNSVISYFGS